MEKNNNNNSVHFKVVIIDDDAMVLRSVNTALADFGFPVTAFTDPVKALEWIGKDGADIVITDIRMPGCDGFEVLRRVKEADSECDVIFITAHGQLDIAIRALREGATDFFEKPFTPAALRAAMERTERFRRLTKQNELLTCRVNILSNELLSRNSSKNVILGQSAGMKKVAEEIMDVADSSATVLIRGESGTGKELVANAIHLASSRRAKPFLVLNCPSVPEDLFESEVFGHKRGAFTGAIETTPGHLEAAAGGTLLFDEIGDLPLRSQAKILRLLEQKTYSPVGEHKERHADVRVIAATNRSLEQMIKEKHFREDLYYRLTVCAINIPPLRARKDDISMLALYFTLQFASEMGKSIDGIDEEALPALCAYDYPGNVRELRNIMESAVIHCKHSGALRKEDLPNLATRTGGEAMSATWGMDTIKFDDVERRLYKEAMERTGDNVSAAARLLGLTRSKLRRRMSALGLDETAP